MMFLLVEHPGRLHFLVVMIILWTKVKLSVYLQMALMKLISNEDELKRLSVSYTDHTTKGKSLNEKQFDFSNLSKQEKKQYKDLLLKMKSQEEED